MEVEEEDEIGQESGVYEDQLDLQIKDQQAEEHNRSYVTQLHQVFLSCDTSGKGQLQRAELIELCSQLHLEDQAGLIVDHLLGDEPDATVDFDDFKEKFIFLLAQSVNENDVISNDIANVDKDDIKKGPKIIKDQKISFKSPEREVSPRYVWGSKKYGRRSRPELDTENVDTNFQLNSDFSDPEEVFLFDSNEDGLSSVFEDDRVSLDGHHLDIKSTHNQKAEHRRASWSHQTQVENTNSSSSSLYHSLPSAAANSHRQGAKRRRRMRSSEDRSSLDSESPDEQPTEPSCKWSEESGQQESAPSGGGNNVNDEEYLQSIWMKLGVGADGFLNKDGLIRVCEHIGMEKLSEEVISQLFEKLDIDQDGQISFEEFLHLFRNGESANHSLPPVLESKVTVPSAVEPINSTTSNSSSPTSSSSIKPYNNEMGIFQVISAECTRPGYVEPEVIFELWESLGITSGYTILRHLGFNSCNPISLLNLTNALEDALQSPRTNSRDSEVCQAAIATYNQELKYLRKTIEQMVIEREKLRGDVTEANSRATLMAQEVDDHQIKLENSSQMKITNIEKKYQEQIRRLQEDLESEREVFNTQMSIDKQGLEEEVANLRESETTLREQLALAQNENRNLDEEIRELNQQLNEARKLNQHHQMEAESIMAYKAEITYEERLRAMSLELENIRLENKQLKDNNDELSTELENMRQQLIASKLSTKSSIINNENYINTNEDDAEDVANQQQNTGRGQSNLQHRRNGSWLSDYIKDQHVIKRRGSGQQNSSAEQETLTVVVELENCNNKVPSIGHPKDKGLASDDSNTTAEEVEAQSPKTTDQASDFSDEEEYLQLNSHLNRDTDASTVTNKTAIKKVFEVLKKSFIEMYLDEQNEQQITENEVTISEPKFHHHRLQRMNAISQAEEQNEVKNNLTRTSTSTSAQSSVTLNIPQDSSDCKTSESGVELTPKSSSHAPLLMDMVWGSGSWWNRSIDDENVLLSSPQSCFDNEEFAHQIDAEQRWKSELEHERATWRTAMKNMEEQCEEMRDHQARKEVAFQMNMLKNEVYWRDQLEQERVELEQEKNELQEKVLSLEFQLANSLKMLRERDVEKFNHQLGEESDEENQALRQKSDYKIGNNYLGRSRSWKEYGASCSNTERRRKRWLRSKNNLEALDIEADSLDGRDGNHSDASDEDEDYQSSHKRLHEQQQDKRKINPKLFEKLMLDRGATGAATGTGKANCVIDMNVLHSINQHLNQQENRCRQLEAALKTRTMHADKILRETRKNYDDEQQRLTQLLQKTRTFLKEQTIKVKGQGEKLFQSENLIKELSWENAELIKLLQTSEEKRLKSEKSSYGLKQKCEALNQLVAEMYRIQTI